MNFVRAQMFRPARSRAVRDDNNDDEFGDDIGRRGESREQRRARRLAAREARVRAREQKRRAKYEAKYGRKAGRGAKRRKTLEDAGKLLETIDEATDEGGALSEVVDDEAPVEELPVDYESEDEFGDDDRWNPTARLGRMRIQTRRGVRAATIELRPGLYIVAEVPERALAGIGGPVTLATKVVEATVKALARPRDQAALPGPAPSAPTASKTPWKGRDAIGCECRWQRE